MNRLILLIAISPIINCSSFITFILQASLISRCILYRAHYAYTAGSIIIERASICHTLLGKWSFRYLKITRATREEGKENSSGKPVLHAYLHNGAEWYSLSDNISSCTIRPYSRDKASPMPRTPPFNSKYPSLIAYARTARRHGLFIARYLSARRLAFLRSCSRSFEYLTIEVAVIYWQYQPPLTTSRQ